MIIHPDAPVVTAADVNPPQIDVPPVTIAAAIGVPVDQLPDLLDVHLAAIPH